ncbi:unnamed protein product [Amoebophrya sp. A120]|nr:unnamed protein product [Amoebophrya sp. A120]|eukprot:GSA120T00025839001.1
MKPSKMNMLLFLLNGWWMFTSIFHQLPLTLWFFVEARFVELKTGGEAGDHDAGMTGEAVAGEVDGVEVNNAATSTSPGGAVKTNENYGKKLNFLELDTNAEFLEVQPGKISQEDEDVDQPRRVEDEVDVESGSGSSSSSASSSRLLHPQKSAGFLAARAQAADGAGVMNMIASSSSSTSRMEMVGFLQKETSSQELRSAGTTEDNIQQEGQAGEEDGHMLDYNNVRPDDAVATGARAAAVTTEDDHFLHHGTTSMETKTGQNFLEKKKVTARPPIDATVLQGQLSKIPPRTCEVPTPCGAARKEQFEGWARQGTSRARRNSAKTTQLKKPMAGTGQAEKEVTIYRSTDGTTGTPKQSSADKKIWDVRLQALDEADPLKEQEKLVEFVELVREDATAATSLPQVPRANTIDSAGDYVSVEKAKGKRKRARDLAFPNMFLLDDDPAKQSNAGVRNAVQSSKIVRIRDMWKSNQQNFVPGGTPVPPESILQGPLGHCYFMAALQNLANQGLLLEPEKVSPSGLWLVPLYIRSKWEFILVDDHLPTVGGQVSGVDTPDDVCYCGYRPYFTFLDPEDGSRAASSISSGGADQVFGIKKEVAQEEPVAGGGSTDLMTKGRSHDQPAQQGTTMQISITVELIIKAVAKVMGGYFALEAGITPFAVRAVAGGQSFFKYWTIQCTSANSASCPAKYNGRGVATPEVSKALFLMSEESLTGLPTHKMGANGQVSLQSAVTYVPEYQKNTDSVKVLSPDPNQCELFYDPKADVSKWQGMKALKEWKRFSGDASFKLVVTSGRKQTGEDEEAESFLTEPLPLPSDCAGQEQEVKGHDEPESASMCEKLCYAKDSCTDYLFARLGQPSALGRTNVCLAFSSKDKASIPRGNEALLAKVVAERSPLAGFSDWKENFGEKVYKEFVRGCLASLTQQTPPLSLQSPLKNTQMDQIRELTFGSRGLWFFVSHFDFATDVAANLAEILNSTPFLANGKAQAFSLLPPQSLAVKQLMTTPPTSAPGSAAQGPLDAAALQEVFTEYAVATERSALFQYEKAMTFLFRDVLGGNFDVRHPPNLKELPQQDRHKAVRCLFFDLQEHILRGAVADPNDPSKLRKTHVLSFNIDSKHTFAQGLYQGHAYTFEALHVLAIPTMSVNPNEYLLIYAALIRNPHGRRDSAWNPFKNANGQLSGGSQDLRFLANGQYEQLDLKKPRLTETLVHLLNVPQDVLPNEAGFGTDAKKQRELLWNYAKRPTPPDLVALGDSLTEGFNLKGGTSSSDLWVNKLGIEMLKLKEEKDGSGTNGAMKSGLQILNGGNSGAFATVLTGAEPLSIQSQPGQHAHAGRVLVSHGPTGGSFQITNSGEPALRAQAGDGGLLQHVRASIVGNVGVAEDQKVELTTVFFGTNEVNQGKFSDKNTAENLVKNMKQILTEALKFSRFVIVILPLVENHWKLNTENLHYYRDIYKQGIVNLKSDIIGKIRNADGSSAEYTAVGVVDLDYLPSFDGADDRGASNKKYYKLTLPGTDPAIRKIMDELHPDGEGHKVIADAVLEEYNKLKGYAKDAGTGSVAKAPLTPFYILEPGCVEGKDLNSKLKKPDEGRAAPAAAGANGAFLSSLPGGGLPFLVPASWTGAGGRGASADPYLRTLQLPPNADGPTTCMKPYSRQQNWDDQKAALMWMPWSSFVLYMGGEKQIHQYAVPAQDRNKQAAFQAIPLSSSFKPLRKVATNMQKPPKGAKLTEESSGQQLARLQSQWEGTLSYWADFFHTEVSKRLNEAGVELGLVLEQAGQEAQKMFEEATTLLKDKLEELFKSSGDVDEADEDEDDLSDSDDEGEEFAKGAEGVYHNNPTVLFLGDSSTAGKLDSSSGPDVSPQSPALWVNQVAQELLHLEVRPAKAKGSEPKKKLFPGTTKDENVRKLTVINAGNVGFTQQQLLGRGGYLGGSEGVGPPQHPPVHARRLEVVAKAAAGSGGDEDEGQRWTQGPIHWTHATTFFPPITKNLPAGLFDFSDWTGAEPAKWASSDGKPMPDEDKIFLTTISFGSYELLSGVFFERALSSYVSSYAQTELDLCGYPPYTGDAEKIKNYVKEVQDLVNTLLTHYSRYVVVVLPDLSFHPFRGEGKITTKTTDSGSAASTTTTQPAWDYFKGVLLEKGLGPRVAITDMEGLQDETQKLDTTDFVTSYLPKEIRLWEKVHESPLRFQQDMGLMAKYQLYPNEKGHAKMAAAVKEVVKGLITKNEGNGDEAPATASPDDDDDDDDDGGEGSDEEEQKPGFFTRLFSWFTSRGSSETNSSKPNRPKTSRTVGTKKNGRGQPLSEQEVVNHQAGVFGKLKKTLADTWHDASHFLKRKRREWFDGASSATGQPDNSDGAGVAGAAPLNGRTEAEAMVPAPRENGGSSDELKSLVP